MLEAYQKLKERFREITLINRIDAVLGWDQQTYLPESGNAYRAEQNAWLASAAHRLLTSPETGTLIHRCQSYGFSEGSIEFANVREWHRSYERATRLPADLVESFSKETALAHEVWVRARKQSDFKIFESSLQRLVDLTRTIADCYGYTGHPYDALLDLYEPNLKTQTVTSLFEKLTPKLSRLVQSAFAIKITLPKGPYPIDAQQRFNQQIAERIGFDFSRGRIDTAAHPFCTELGSSDIRLTTRYDENDFTSSLYGILHEAGHGLYEQGLLSEHYGTPVGTSVSLGIHESQSRLWENHVGRSHAFWNVWYDEAVRHFPQLSEITPEELTHYVNRVQRSLIRVEADEVTYDLHIILRFRLERRLIEGSLAVHDIPEAWNALFEELFGLKVPSDAMGCLQDVHWCGGSFGYFPTYTIGNLNAAQLFAYATNRSAAIRNGLASGNYAPLLAWLRENIHQHGSHYAPEELIKKATGEPTHTDAFFRHLENIVLLGSHTKYK